MSLQPIELDVRAIPPREKHPTIFRTFDAHTLKPAGKLKFANEP